MAKQLTSAAGHWEPRLRALASSVGSVIAGSSRAVAYTAAPGQSPCTHSYSVVHSGQPHTAGNGLKGHISRFKHFWQRVLADALLGPRSVGALR